MTPQEEEALKKSILDMEAKMSELLKDRDSRPGRDKTLDGIIESLKKELADARADYAKAAKPTEKKPDEPKDETPVAGFWA